MVYLKKVFFVSGIILIQVTSGFCSNNKQRESDFISLVKRISHTVKTADSLLDFNQILTTSTFSVEDTLKKNGAVIDSFFNELEHNYLYKNNSVTPLTTIARVPAEQPDSRYEAELSIWASRLKQYFSTIVPLFQQLAHEKKVHAAIDSLKGESYRKALFQPIDEYEYAKIDAQIEANIKTLRHYKVKYGPLSPRLNVLETVVNYGLQWVPPFQPTDNGPSPYEFIAAYSSTYFNIVSFSESSTRWQIKDKILLSLIEVGCRRYIFRDGWGDGSLKGLLKPGYIAAALAIGSEREGFLQNPLRGDPSFGVVLSYGVLKLPGCLITEHPKL